MNLIKAKDVPRDGIIIDVLSDKSYSIEHIKGAKNFCVYELAFADKIKGAFSPEDHLYIYGYSSSTGESERAYSILASIGFGNVYVIEGGLLEWKKQGLDTESKPTGSLDGVFVALDETRIEWTGRNIGNKHNGKVNIKRGEVVFEDNKLKKGEIAIDMNSIANNDLSGEMNTFLVNHLKSSDFFEVSKYPEATLKFVKAEEINDYESMPNYNISAELAIKDITNIISFPAYVHEKEAQPFINAHFDIDRIKWNVMYGSEKFFAKLGMHIISDLISFDIIALFKRK